jgi:exopolyphosphatase/pppGpp-phosphohydrolase
VEVEIRATIDVGTNAALLLVADRQPEGRFQAVGERAEITRLGRGVGKSRRLSPEAWRTPVSCSPISPCGLTHGDHTLSMPLEPRK